MLILVISYTLALTFLPPSVPLHFAHSLGWILFHTFGLGMALKSQSENRFLVKHFMKHYHYLVEGSDEAVKEAFGNWKAVYNMSMCMTFCEHII